MTEPNDAGASTDWRCRHCNALLGHVIGGHLVAGGVRILSACRVACRMCNDVRTYQTEAGALRRRPPPDVRGAADAPKEGQ